VAALLTGLWVTIGAAIPIGYVILRLLRTANGGELGPELLGRPGVVLTLLAAYAVAASIGGWAAAWVTIERRYRLTFFLSASHVGTWMFVLKAGASPFGTALTVGFAAAAVAGTIAGVSARVGQVRRGTRMAPSE
jgi:hypothetical protein